MLEQSGYIMWIFFFFPVVLCHYKGLQLQEVCVMALGRVTYRQKTPCTRQAWSWVTFSEIRRAEERVILALPTELGRAWPPWPDPNQFVTPNGAWAYVAGNRNYTYQRVCLQRLPTSGDLTVTANASAGVPLQSVSRGYFGFFPPRGEIRSLIIDFP